MSVTKEIWKTIELKRGRNAVQKYAVSNQGRLSSYLTDIKNARILRASENSGFYQVNIRAGDKSKAILIHRAVAEAFLKQPTLKHSFVLHLDHDKKNNHVSNLKWATQEQQVEHVKQSPLVMKAKKHRMVVGRHSKTLDAKKVQKMKEMIWNPERKKTLAQIAQQFGVSEMNIYRIKGGEFWYHIRVEGEPLHPKYKAYLKNAEYHEKQQQKTAAKKPVKKAVKKAVAKKAVKAPVAKKPATKAKKKK